MHFLPHLELLKKVQSEGTIPLYGRDEGENASIAYELFSEGKLSCSNQNQIKGTPNDMFANLSISLAGRLQLEAWESEVKEKNFITNSLRTVTERYRSSIEHDIQQTKQRTLEGHFVNNSLGSGQSYLALRDNYVSYLESYADKFLAAASNAIEAFDLSELEHTRASFEELFLIDLNFIAEQLENSFKRYIEEAQRTQRNNLFVSDKTIHIIPQKIVELNLLIKKKMSEKKNEPTITIKGNNNQINQNSNHNSINIDNTKNVFNEAREAIAQIQQETERTELLNLLSEFEKSINTPESLGAYQRFINAAASHMAILSPFIAPFSALLQ
ncbi:hypothetical protein MLD52_09510 [Puniceicoccaceae bacterium K14]|nr:hypothetical protein [Puniceicoccaceae bacterium K14]